jgi:predicted RNase H-like nuclease
MNIIGIDAATKARRVGLAVARYDEGTAEVTDVSVGGTFPALVERVADAARAPCLLAIDAPLGWPAALSRELAEHRAGGPLDADADALFHRHTDEVVQRELGKRPLEVGANLIARTAHAALGILEAIREQTGFDIPLAWGPDVSEAAAIEVYPGATLVAHDIPTRGYKARGAAGVAARENVVADLDDLLDLPDTSLLVENDDVLDAAVCVLAAVDFLTGACIPPGDDLDRLAVEGWIWVKTQS